VSSSIRLTLILEISNLLKSLNFYLYLCLENNTLAQVKKITFFKFTNVNIGSEKMTYRPLMVTGIAIKKLVSIVNAFSLFFLNGQFVSPSILNKNQSHNVYYIKLFT